MSEHEQASMLSIKVLLFCFAGSFILMNPLADSRIIRTYTYAGWIHTDN